MSVTSVTLYDPRLERIRCMKSRQSFSRLTRCGRVRLARFTLEDHAYGASRLPKRPKTTVLQSIFIIVFFFQYSLSDVDIRH